MQLNKQLKWLKHQGIITLYNNSGKNNFWVDWLIDWEAQQMLVLRDGYSEILFDFPLLLL